MRCHDRVNQCVPHDFANGHIDRIDASPLLKYFARARNIVIIQREMDIGEVMAELAKTEREIHDRHVPGEGEDEVDLVQQVINDGDRQRPRQHHSQPGQHAMLALAGVEAVPGAKRMILQQSSDWIARRQSAHLLKEECQ